MAFCLQVNTSELLHNDFNFHTRVIKNMREDALGVEELELMFLSLLVYNEHSQSYRSAGSVALNFIAMEKFGTRGF